MLFKSLRNRQTCAHVQCKPPQRSMTMALYVASNDSWYTARNFPWMVTMCPPVECCTCHVSEINAWHSTPKLGGRIFFGRTNNIDSRRRFDVHCIRSVLREMALIFRCFAFFRFSQTFIDIREKERKRLQRGLVSVPPKYPKLDDDKLIADQRKDSNDGSENSSVSSTTTSLPINRDDNPNGFKPEHLLELQEKITKEILSTKLQENEMHELQVLSYLMINT